MSSSTKKINPKPCNYGCNTRIYWNITENAYFEVFSGNRHQCPNRQQNSNYNKKSRSLSSSSYTNANKPSYYSTNKKSSWSTATTSKPKMSNSLELLQGPIKDIQKKYEILSDIVTEYNGKVHGSQSHVLPTNNNTIQLIVYYEVPAEGKREEVKRKFENLIEIN